MKEFNLVEAIAGKPVCFKDGTPVKILATDLKGETPICIVYFNGREDIVEKRHANGSVHKNISCLQDLVMAPMKMEGYINLYADGLYVCPSCITYSSESSAKKNIFKSKKYLGTCKVTWED